MAGTGFIGFLIIIINTVCSYNGFRNNRYFESYKFEVDKVLINKDYKRLITSGFLHVGWLHLVFNMLSLYAFSGLIEKYLGSYDFLLIYFSSLAGGNLLSLFVNRNHGDYSAVGASGAVCGIVFASIALFPGIGISFFGLPFSIPSWLYGVLFVLYSIYGIRSKKDNIGHEAHLGGALIGMFVALLMQPNAFSANYPTILIIALPSILFIYLITTRPGIMLVDNYYFKTHADNYSIDHHYNAKRQTEQQDIDNILDKINQKGIKSLNTKERSILKQYAGK